MSIVRKQRSKPRLPRQQRSRHKVELILAAAKVLIGKGGLPLLTTNALAATAGVSIGTLYQYFASKEAILDELATREMAAMTARVLAVIDDPSATPEQRVVGAVRAVLASYDRRRNVHRAMLERSLAQGSKRLGALTDALLARFTSEARRGSNRAVLTPSQAFVLTHSVIGVLRAFLCGEGDGLPVDEIENALADLIGSYAKLSHPMADADRRLATAGPGCARD